MPSLRVLFPITFDLERLWRGGFNLALGALAALPPEETRVEIVYVYADVPPQAELEALGTVSRHDGQTDAVAYLNAVHSRQAREKSVLVSLGHCGLWWTNLTRVIYIPDFQHEYLPGNFPPDELSERRLGYQVESATADGVWVSSRTVATDLERFIANLPVQRLVLPFPSVRPDWRTGTVPADIPRPYVLCVSQDWPHKNLRMLLRVLDEDGAVPEHWSLVIASNRTNLDPGRHARSRVLTDVDDATLGALYREAEAFVLPSAFEGWSTVVEEAIRFELPLLLSDIPTLREQVQHGAVFFDPSSPDALRSALQTVLGDPDHLARLRQEVGLNSRPTPQEYGAALGRFLLEV
jgi:glycosyltransferase involved in cell wall biosynthesis